MFLIFGIKRLKRRLATVFAMCGRCRTPAAQVVVRVGTWFSLFFIPVVPLGTRYISTCTLCGESVRIDKAQALQTVAAARQLAAEPSTPPASEPEGSGSPPQTPLPPARP
ncbi:MAG TPA: zinc-ribbon domain-containing protein [Acidimicrobiales bacterium]|nr:zinc-ribbon domain-containing protein [Acidimicrobiales bacterium]